MIIATDGSCPANPGPGGWAWVSELGRYASGYEADTTNNRMELTAVLEALRSSGVANALSLGVPVTILTDSKYVIGCLTEWVYRWRENGWRNAKGKRVDNVDLINAACYELSKLDTVCRDGARVEFEHVRGHTGNPLNELADRYAGEAARFWQ